MYEEAFCLELKTRNLKFVKQKQLEVHYKGQKLNNKFCADLIIEDKILVELKAIKVMTKQVEAQLLNYLKITMLKVGLAINFGGPKYEFIRRIL